jgi:hypothetical protein
MDGRPGLGTDRELVTLESSEASAHFAVLEEKYALLQMKKLGLLKRKDVAASWNDNTWPFDPMAVLGGSQWQRVNTELNIIHEGGHTNRRRVTELHLGDCLRGSLDEFSVLVCKFQFLKLLHLHDNSHLIGELEKIKFSSFPLLEQLAVQRTKIETTRGLSMLGALKHLKYVDVSFCSKVTGTIPQALLMKPGLVLNLKGSGLIGEDTIGNDVRSQARWGDRNAARKPR